jgi:hypothetical protein
MNLTDYLCHRPCKWAAAGSRTLVYGKAGGAHSRSMHMLGNVKRSIGASRLHLVFAICLFAILGCSESNQVTLEFRLAEDESGPGLTETVFDQTGERFYLHDEVILDQSDVESANVVTERGRIAVALALTSAGARKFEEFTRSNVGKRCGMILNGRLVSAPWIMAPISSGRAIIMSDFTEAEASRIAERLSRGGSSS